MSAATLPQQFGRYRILKPLGKGGMGAVYLAEDTQLGRRVALKVPHIDADAGPSVLERFYREARAAAALDHPNICTLHDVGTHDGITYMTMAYIEGQTLAEALRSGKPLTQVAAARIVYTLAMALAKAHQLGVIHRDLKPANVMMNERGEPVLMDFGLARLTTQNKTRLTQLGSMMGTPSYMPPEQVRGDVDAMGPACDIYSLGVILYELLTSHLPFEGSVDAVLGQILTQPPLSPLARRAGLDPRLAAICLKALQKEIGARHRSMTEFAAALSECLRPESPPVARVAPARPAMPVKPSDPRFDMETLPPRPKAAADPRLNIETQRLANPVPSDAAQGTQVEGAVLAPMVLAPPRRSAGGGALLGCSIGAAVGTVVVLGVLVVALVLWSARPNADGPKDNSKQALANDKDGPAKDVLGVTQEKGEPFKDVKDAKLSGPSLDKNVKDKTAPVVEDELIREMKFVPVKRGTFWMGGGSREGEPKKQVMIDNHFELAAYTVTQGQWEAVMGVGSNPSYFSREGKGSASVADVSGVDLRRFPVETVSWNDVQKFLEKLNEREQGNGWDYRLPMEAEWEYACRGGAGTSKEECSFDFYIANGTNDIAKGTNDLSWDQANFDGGFPAGQGVKGKYLGRTTQVGQYQANKLGLCDMHGNVSQWCDDLYDEKGSDRVFRGGGWYDVGLYCRAAYHSRFAPSTRINYLGFRLARVPSES